MNVQVCWFDVFQQYGFNSQFGFDQWCMGDYFVIGLGDGDIVCCDNDCIFCVVEMGFQIFEGDYIIFKNIGDFCLNI